MSVNTTTPSLTIASSRITLAHDSDMSPLTDTTPILDTDADAGSDVVTASHI